DVVRAAMALRKKAQPDKSSIIDKLIEEALLEFTSLQDDKAEPSAPKKDEPLGFEDPSKWVDDFLAPPPPKDTIKSMPPPAVEEGNLAALEETDPDLQRVLMAAKKAEAAEKEAEKEKAKEKPKEKEPAAAKAPEPEKSAPAAAAPRP